MPRAFLAGLFLVSWAIAGIVTLAPSPPPLPPAFADDDGFPGAELLPSNPAGATAADALTAADARAARGLPAESPPAPDHRIKTGAEKRAESIIGSIYSKYFREVRVGRASLTLRMPFGLDDERGAGPGFHQAFYLGGKGQPQELWPAIVAALSSKDFKRYAAALTRPGQKVVVLDLRRRAWSVSRESSLVASMEAGRYPGTPTRIDVLREGEPLTTVDIYNYLYAVAAIGVDCTGFTYHVESMLARSFGIDIDRELGRLWHMSPGHARQLVGLWFFDPANGMTDLIADRIDGLRPGDVILFRGSDGLLKHSAIIERVDFEAGIIRYVQSTDWAVQDERGVHRSEIRFDPARPSVSLRHYSVTWLQQVRPPFEGEVEPRDWRDDGDRFRWYPQAGGSMVVRPRFLAQAILGTEPWYYVNLVPPSPGAGEVLPPPRHGAPLAPR